MEHSEVLECSGIFISNPEYRILFRNNLTHMNISISTLIDEYLMLKNE